MNQKDVNVDVEQVNAGWDKIYQNSQQHVSDSHENQSLIAATDILLEVWILLVAKVSFVWSSRPEVLLGKGVLNICSKFIREHQYQSVISVKSLLKSHFGSNFTEIILSHGCSPVNLLHIFRVPFPMNTSGQLVLKLSDSIMIMLQAKSLQLK